MLKAPEKLEFENEHISCVCEISQDWRLLKLNGVVKSPLSYQKMIVIAANSPDRMTTYTGSSLPFPNSEIAFDGTTNIVEVPKDGRFTKIFGYPNSYYAPDGCTKVQPSIFFTLYKNQESTPMVFTLELPELIPLQVRTLTHRPLRQVKGPSFYTDKAELIGVRSAYETMLAWKDVKIYNGIA
jgi:hypothetical protein